MLHFSTIFHFYIPHVTFLQHFPGLPLTFLHHFQLFTFWADTSNIEIPAVKKHKVLNIHTTFSPLLPLGAKKIAIRWLPKGIQQRWKVSNVHVGEFDQTPFGRVSLQAFDWTLFDWKLTDRTLFGINSVSRSPTDFYSANDQMIMITTIFWITNKILRANRNSCWINTIFFVSETCHHHHH